MFIIFANVKNNCKEEGCDSYPIIGLNGYCTVHAPEELKTKHRTKKQQYILNRNKQSAIIRKLHLDQKKNDTNVVKPNTYKKPISFTSKKRLAELKIYAVLKKDFLTDFPTCMANLSGCKKKPVEVHHMAKRGVNLNNVDSWISVCRNCHIEITLNPKMAIEKGLSISSFKKPSDDQSTAILSKEQKQ